MLRNCPIFILIAVTEQWCDLMVCNHSQFWTLALLEGADAWLNRKVKVEYFKPVISAAVLLLTPEHLRKHCCLVVGWATWAPSNELLLYLRVQRKLHIPKMQLLSTYHFVYSWILALNFNPSHSHAQCTWTGDSKNTSVTSSSYEYSRNVYSDNKTNVRIALSLV